MIVLVWDEELCLFKGGEKEEVGLGLSDRGWKEGLKFVAVHLVEVNLV